MFPESTERSAMAARFSAHAARSIGLLGVGLRGEERL